MTSSLISGHCGVLRFFLGDRGADSGGKGKTKLAEKKGAKKSKERQEEPLGTMSFGQFQTVAAVLASDWCQKTVVFFCPIRSQQTYGEALLEMKSSNLSAKFKGFPSDFTLESHR